MSSGYCCFMVRIVARIGALYFAIIALVAVLLLVLAKFGL